jgi:hypothetical protein
VWIVHDSIEKNLKRSITAENKNAFAAVFGSTTSLCVKINRAFCNAKLDVPVSPDGEFFQFRETRGGPATSRYGIHE